MVKEYFQSAAPGAAGPGLPWTGATKMTASGRVLGGGGGECHGYNCKGESGYWVCGNLRVHPLNQGEATHR